MLWMRGESFRYSTLTSVAAGAASTVSVNSSGCDAGVAVVRRFEAAGGHAIAVGAADEAGEGEAAVVPGDETGMDETAASPGDEAAIGRGEVPLAGVGDEEPSGHDVATGASIEEGEAAGDWAKAAGDATVMAKASSGMPQAMERMDGRDTGTSSDSPGL
jgi:hypothetical protein